jgi:hypothetical protein
MRAYSGVSATGERPAVGGLVMIVCEYFFKEFHARGNGDYLSAWVAQVDQMGAEGWKVLDCCRKNDQPGFWTGPSSWAGRSASLLKT